MEKQQQKRIITAAIGIPVLIVLIILGGWFFAIPCLLLAAGGFWEYYRISVRMNVANSFAWTLGGFCYIIIGFICLFLARVIGGFTGILWLLLIVWSTDTAAYELGRRFGKRKLAPQISPNKTVEGALGGLAGGLLIGLLYGLIFLKVNFFAALFFPLLTSALGQIGDLLESRVKRMAGVKDSGNLLPGHGGILDRFDSLMLTAPFFCIFLLICL